jgi:hypothetical protein
LKVAFPDVPEHRARMRHILEWLLAPEAEAGVAVHADD